MLQTIRFTSFRVAFYGVLLFLMTPGSSFSRNAKEHRTPVLILSEKKIPDPVDVAVGENGDWYVLSRSTATLSQFSPSGGLVRSVAKLGASPCGFDVDSEGKVYVALTGQNQVIRLKPGQGTFELDTTFNGTGAIGNSQGEAGKGNGEFNVPYDVAVSEQAVYVSDQNNNRIQKFTHDGVFSRALGSKGSGEGQLSQPKGLRFGRDGVLFVVEGGNNRVAAILNDRIQFQSRSGPGRIQLRSPQNLATDSRYIYIADTGNNRIKTMDAFLAEYEPGSSAQQLLWSVSSEIGLKGPSSVVATKDPEESIFYVADTGNNRVICMKIGQGGAVFEIPKGESPADIWRKMKKCMAAKNLEGALSYFSEDAIDNYREFFKEMGVKKGSQVVSEIGEITPVTNDGSSAQYRFERKVDGVVVSFNVSFVNENGHWRISEF